MTSPIRLWDLAGEDPDRRFSPYCWRVRLALLHKGLAFEAVPWRFTEKERIAFSGQGKVPVIEDGGTVVYDSWTIAQYLEDRYPDRPSLFGGGAGRALSHFVSEWASQVVVPQLFRFICRDIRDCLGEEDAAYYRSSREARLKATLEDYAADRDQRLAAFRADLRPLRTTLGSQPFIAGAAPAWADYAVFGAFQWARCVSPYRLLSDDDPVAAWRERMMDLYDGEARRAVGFPP